MAKDRPSHAKETKMKDKISARRTDEEDGRGERRRRLIGQGAFCNHTISIFNRRYLDDQRIYAPSRAEMSFCAYSLFFALVLSLLQYEILDLINQALCELIQCRMVLLDEVGSLLSDHVYRILDTCIWDEGEDASIDDAKVADTMDLETTVDDTFLDG
ncbi:hypothetical protein KCV07_g535, partial [Aureobasidium melanogenum]